MAEVIWTGPAIADLHLIADYIALDNEKAASSLVQSVIAHVTLLATHPKSGPIIPEMRGSSTLYRQIIEPPCRVFYRVQRDRVWILNVIRGEMHFRAAILQRRFRRMSNP